MQRLRVFFFLTFVATWTCFFAAAALSQPTGTADSIIAPIRWALLLVGTFAPSLVAIGITFLTNRRKGVSDLLRSIFEPQIALRWYWFAVTYMAAIKLAVLIVDRAVTGVWLPIDRLALAAVIPSIAISTPVQSGEEIGWRGYALPRLADRIGFAGASLLLGLIWGIWHMPLFFVRGLNQYGQSFPLFALGTTAMSVAITWLYVRTNGSLLLTMLMHSAINQTAEIIHDSLPAPGNPFSFAAPFSLFLTLAFLWIPAAYFLFRMMKFGRPAKSFEHGPFRRVSS